MTDAQIGGANAAFSRSLDPYVIEDQSDYEGHLDMREAAIRFEMMIRAAREMAQELEDTCLNNRRPIPGFAHEVSGMLDDLLHDTSATAVSEAIRDSIREYEDRGMK